MKTLKKTILIGLDGPVPKRVYKYAVQGKLPVIKSLIEESVWA